MSTENSPAFNFQLLKISLTPKCRSKTKDCISIVQGNELVLTEIYELHAQLKIMLTEQNKSCLHLRPKHSVGKLLPQ